MQEDFYLKLYNMIDKKKPLFMNHIVSRQENIHNCFKRYTDEKSERTR